MRRLILIEFLVLITASSFSVYAQTKTKEVEKIDAQKILERAEMIRNPSEDYRCKVSLFDLKNKETIDQAKADPQHSKIKPTSVFETAIKGRDKALVKYIEPAADVGTSILMVGQDMSVFVAGTSKPMRISANQKLTGNAAYGDVARLSFIGNYNAKFLRKDIYEGKKAHVLELSSIAGRPVTYDLIEYWIEQETFRPLLTTYKTASGKAIREGTYSQYENVFGVERPTKFLLTNFLDRNHVTILTFSSPEKAKLPDLMFERQNLGKK